MLVATLERVTMHMVTADDHAWLQPKLRPVLEQTSRRPFLRSRRCSPGSTWRRWTGDDVEVTPPLPAAEAERQRLRDWLARR